MFRHNLQEAVLAPGTQVFEPGEPIDHLYFIRQGIVSIVAPLADGGEIETAMLGRDAVLGSAAAFGLRQAFARAVVQVETFAWRVPTSRIVDVLPMAKSLAAALATDAEKLMFQIHQTAACNAVHPFEARLARWLLRTADCLEKESIPFTQELMSQMLGVQRTTANLMLRMMVNAGVLRSRRGSVEIVDRIALEKTACECYSKIRGHVALS